VRTLIYAVAGIALSPAKKDMVYSRLARRLRALGIASFARYLDFVEEGDAQELEAFVNALTTNLTSFFRESHHFRMLAERLAQQRGSRRIRIWSCASSTGEEPYSIAMTAIEALGRQAADARILATDIDTNVLAKAKQGIYPLEQLQKVPQQQVKRFFLRGEGRRQGFARVKEELRRMVCFRQLNLLDEQWPMQGRFDFIFCRNVMIYFDKTTQQAILKRIAARLSPEGLLFVGHSESFHGAQNLFTTCGNTAYSLKR
jgi:chemotaxis protein methyltransferase CheR